MTTVTRICSLFSIQYFTYFCWQSSSSSCKTWWLCMGKVLILKSELRNLNSRLHCCEASDSNICTSTVLRGCHVYNRELMKHPWEILEFLFYSSTRRVARFSTCWWLREIIGKYTFRRIANFFFVMCRRHNKFSLLHVFSIICLCIWPTTR